MPTLFERITSEENFDEAYKRTLRGRNKYSNEAMRFMANETYNLAKLRRSVIDGTYSFQGYLRFVVTEPKKRVIDAPHFEDKIVQLAVNSELKQVYRPCFIFDSYASQDGKGTHKCVDRISHFMRKAKWEWGGSAYIVKLDIRKFFYTIDRDILKTILRKKITYPRTTRLIYEVIDSAEEIDEKGLPLGNTLSQLFANVYLNELDQYCKRTLRAKYYVRYMDDVIVIVPDKAAADRVLRLADVFVREKLNLELNKHKSKVFPIGQGVNAVGFKIHSTHRLLRNSSKRKIKRKARSMPRAIKAGKMTAHKAEQILNSWNGHAKHGNSRNLVARLVKDNPHIGMAGNGALRIIGL